MGLTCRGDWATLRLYLSVKLISPPRYTPSRSMTGDDRQADTTVTLREPFYPEHSRGVPYMTVVL